MFVNREKILIQRPSEEDTSDSLKPLLTSDEERFAVQSSTTYSSITSSTSSSSSACTSPTSATGREQLPWGRKTSDQTCESPQAPLSIGNSLPPLLSLDCSLQPPPSRPLPLTFNSPAGHKMDTRAVVHV